MQKNSGYNWNGIFCSTFKTIKSISNQLKSIIID